MIFSIPKILEGVSCFIFGLLACLLTYIGLTHGITFEGHAPSLASKSASATGIYAAMAIGIMLVYSGIMLIINHSKDSYATKSKSATRLYTFVSKKISWCYLFGIITSLLCYGVYLFVLYVMLPNDEAMIGVAQRVFSIAIPLLGVGVYVLIALKLYTKITIDTMTKDILIYKKKFLATAMLNKGHVKVVKLFSIQDVGQVDFSVGEELAWFALINDSDTLIPIFPSYCQSDSDKFSSISDEINSNMAPDV